MYVYKGAARPGPAAQNRPGCNLDWRAVTTGGRGFQRPSDRQKNAPYDDGMVLASRIEQVFYKAPVRS